LSYRYPAAHRSAIDDVSLEIQQGHWVAFIGPTGAGKTTLVDLILGLLVPSSGRILVDGHDIRDITQASLREHIAMVNQDTFLFHDTIAANIRHTGRCHVIGSARSSPCRSHFHP
jgi:ABC-type multidrug transport system fused ATPase/permease subunit